MGKLSEARSKPGEAGRRKPPARSSLGFGRPASPIPLTLDSGNLPSQGVSQKGGSPKLLPTCPASDLLPLQPQARASRDFHLGCSVAPARPAAAAERGPRDSPGQARDGGAGSRFRRVSPRGCFSSAGASPACFKAGNPKARAAGKKSCGRGGRRGGGALAANWFGHCPRTGAEFPPLASIPRPRSQTPPLVPSVLQNGLASRSPGCYVQVPGPSFHSPSPDRRATGSVDLSSPGDDPSPPLLEWSQLLAQRLPPGHLPSGGLFNPLNCVQETFISIFLSLLPSLSPLLSFSSLNPGVLWVEH